jgi:hypothetical protein
LTPPTGPACLFSDRAESTLASHTAAEVAMDTTTADYRRGHTGRSARRRWGLGTCTPGSPPARNYCSHTVVQERPRAGRTGDSRPRANRYPSIFASVRDAYRALAPGSNWYSLTRTLTDCRSTGVCAANDRLLGTFGGTPEQAVSLGSGCAATV